MPNVIYAIDPGGTTGVARFSSNGLFAPDVTSLQVEGGRFGFYEWAEGGHLFDGAPAIVCENFIINSGTATKSRQADPLMIAGYLEGNSYAFGCSFLLQTPAQAKAFATDDKLRHLGWWDPTPGGHANDALRHLLVYLVTQTKDPYTLNRLKELL